ncbi:MAG: low-complexity tail membrane protein, partial [Cyanobacteria bacterium P01_G01_bin.49]
MKNFQAEPFLWIHLGGIAAAPLFLILMWLALAIGDPLPFYWLELLLVAVIGIVPILWMQWQRPFNIFSLLLVAIKPEKLTEEQRKILSLFKTRKNKIFNGIATFGSLIIGWYLYQWAPMGTVTVIDLPQWR